MDIRSGSRKQHDASIQLSSQSWANLQSTTVANHFPKSIDFSLIFTVFLIWFIPFGELWKEQLPQASRKTSIAHLHDAHRKWLLFVRKNKMLICNMSENGWWLSVVWWIKALNTIFRLKRKPQLLCGVVTEISQLNILMLIIGTVTSLWLPVFLHHFWSP